MERPIEIVEYQRLHCQCRRCRAITSALWSKEMELQLGSQYSGVISSDDLSVYNGYPVTAQQKYLAHLRRHFKRLLKLPGKNNQVIGQAFLDL